MLKTIIKKILAPLVREILKEQLEKVTTLSV